MKQLLFGALLTGCLLATTGCAHNSIVASNMTRADRYYGNVGITRHSNNITIVRGSKVPKLSILGNNNTVTVEDGAWLQRIEFWGKGNIVSLPEHLAVRVTEVGDNQIIRRPRELRNIPEEVLVYPPADESPAAAPQIWDEPADSDYDTQPDEAETIYEVDESEYEPTESYDYGTSDTPEPTEDDQP